MNLKQLWGFSALAVLALGALSGCGLCKDEILEETPSPDGKWTAIILTRDCGATTSEYMHVFLQDSNHKHFGEHDSVFATKYIHRLHVSWNGNQSLIIDCENCASNEVSHKVERFGPIQIIYR